MGWWELLSGFENGSFAADDWYADVGTSDWGFNIVTTEAQSGTHSAEPHADLQGGLMHDLDCTPTGYYALRLWFKIVGTVPTAVSGGIFVRLFMTDYDEVQVYIETGNLGNPATPKLRVDFKGTTVRGTTSITLNEWHCLHIHQEVLNATAKTYVYLDDLVTPALQITKNLTGINVNIIEVEPHGWGTPDTGKVYLDSIIGACDVEGDFPVSLLPSSCVDSIFKLYIPETTERYYINIHYTKSHPNQDPDTFEIIVDPDVGSLINYFDSVKITKYDVTEFYGFVEEITPTVGEDGLEYRLTGRCWKLITWKKWTERFQESREIGPVDPMTGEIETGFFGQVKPEELIKFILRVPMSEHPKGKVRHKIGWGIPSDWWTCCASVTAECRYADWVGLRYAGLAWRNRGTVDTLADYTLDVDAFVNTIQEWFTDGANPWIDSDGGGFIHTDSGTGSQYRMSYFTFEDFGVDPQTITNVYLNLDMFGETPDGRIEVYIWDGAWQYVGKYEIGIGGYIHHLTTIDITEYLNTVDKVKNARVYFKRFDRLWMAIDHCYLTVKASLVADPADQRIGDYFVVNLGKSYDDVTAILIECRSNPTMYARNYNIQYAIISDCCAEGGNDAQWNNFDPPINETSNDVRDILHSWKPQDDVHCIRIKLTGNADYPWEISQIYIWQSDAYKYRVLDEGD